MKDLIASDETSLAGCAGLGCLTVILGGWIVSAFLNVGKQAGPTDEPPAPESQQESTVPEHLRMPDLPEEPEAAPVQPSETSNARPSSPRPAPVARQQRTLCGMIEDSIRMVGNCDFLDTGTRSGSTLFVRVSDSAGGFDEDAAALMALDIWGLIGTEPRTPNVVALETSGGSFMVPRKELRTCSAQKDGRSACLRKAITFVGNR